MLRLATLFFLLIFGQDQREDYLTPEQFFGDSYNDAVLYLKANRTEFQALQQQFDVDPKLAMAIVFPEVIRYNRFRDFAETTALELAYVWGGQNVADFSIGHFQMKPSFVEMLEIELLANENLLVVFREITTYSDSSSEASIRRERLARLKQPQWQFLYLACFIRLAHNGFREDISRNPLQELLILSSAYNLSLRANYNDLMRVAQLKPFPYGRLGVGRFSYFDVANYFYQNHSLLR